MIKTFNVVLDIEKDLYGISSPLFSISENDLDSVDLLFQIKQDEKALDLTGTTIELGIKKPSGLTVYQEVEITNAIEGEAVVRMSIQSYIEYGIYTAEIYIRNENQIAVTCPFYYGSRESVMNDETLESTNDWSALQEALFSYDKKPVLTNGVPDFLPEYIGQTALDTTGKRAFIANDLTLLGWQLLGAGEGGGGLVSWLDILAKPLLFPAELHTHVIADVTGLEAALDSKADIGTTEPAAPAEPVEWVDILNKPDNFTPAAHLHAIADVNNLQTTLNSKADDSELAGKSDIGHTHDFTTGITGKPATYPAAAHTHDFNSITNKPATYPAAAHLHAIADVTGLTAELNSKLEAIPADYLTETEGDLRYAFKGEGGTGGGSTLVENVLTSTSTTAALSANQGRILNESKSGIDHNHNDLYSPIIHTHSVDDVEGLLGLLDSKVDDSELAGYAPAIHLHDIEDVNGLTAALNGKVDDAELAGFAPVGHTHDFNSITDKPLTYPATAHVHDIVDVTGLTAALDGKVDDSELAGFAPVDHLHSIEDVTGLTAALDGKVDDLELAGKSDVGHTHDFNSITDKPATYPATAHTHDFTNDITGKPATYPATAHTHDFTTGITGKPATYPATAHTHAIAEVTGLTAALDGKVDDSELAGFAPATHTHDYTTGITGKPATFPPPLMGGNQIGGAMVGNGLAMSTNYLYVKQGASLGISADNSLQVQTTAATPLRFWTGTSAAYAALTKDANTLYFVSG